MMAGLRVHNSEEAPSGREPEIETGRQSRFPGEGVFKAPRISK